MAKRHAELAGRIVESAVSGIRKVADEVRVARIKVAEVVAKAGSVQGTIQSQVASFSAQAETSAAKAVEVMETRVQQLAAHMDVQMSCITVEVTQ